MKKMHDIITLESLTLKHETAGAILVSDGDKDAWLAKSQIEWAENSKGTVQVDLPEWLAQEKGLI